MARNIRVSSKNPLDHHRSSKHILAEISPLVLAVTLALVAWISNGDIFNADVPQQVALACLIALVGWFIARTVTRRLLPRLSHRLDATTTGTISFVVRLVVLVFCICLGVKVLGLNEKAIAVGGAITAVVVGLAAQQTVGKIVAGVVLLTAKPFRVHDRIRLQAGGLAGDLEGVVTSLGLLYTTLARGEDAIIIPNNIVGDSAIIPLREPAKVSIQARLQPHVTPREVHRALSDQITIPLCGEADVDVNEAYADELVVQVSATPIDDHDGAELTEQILAALSDMTQPRQAELLENAV